ncbi:MAG: hypothetical protein ACI3ZN_00585 [Candidatus Cryptobacteroides sp.]
MKVKILIAAVLFWGTILSCFGAPKRSPAKVQLDKVVQSIKSSPDAEVTKLGSVMIAMMKITLMEETHHTQTEDVMLSLMDNSSKMVVAEYPDCSTADKEKFARQLSEALSSFQTIVQFQDEEDFVTIYGLPGETGEQFNDIVMFSQSECMLIQFSGEYSISALRSISNTK